jgi:hypothetical protein
LAVAATATRPKLGRRVDLVPAFPYTFADTEFVQGDGRPE